MPSCRTCRRALQPDTVRTHSCECSITDYCATCNRRAPTVCDRCGCTMYAVMPPPVPTKYRFVITCPRPNGRAYYIDKRSHNTPEPLFCPCDAEHTIMPWHIYTDAPLPEIERLSSASSHVVSGPSHQKARVCGRSQ